MNSMEKWHNTMMSLHCPPSPEQLEREKKIRRFQRAYAEWSEQNEPHTKEEGKAAYQRLYDEHYPKKDKNND